MEFLDTAGVATLWGSVKNHVKSSIDAQQFKTINGTSVKGAGDIQIDLSLYKVVEVLPTSISGLNRLDDCICSVTIEGQSYRSTYYEEGVNITNKDDFDAPDVDIEFPYKSGIFALLSDIPDASNLCRFNFINSISECKSDRINFLFKNDNSNVDLSHLYNFEDGTILFIYSPHFGYEITCKSDTWYYYGNSKGAGETDYVNSGILRLAFLYKEYVYLCSFNK